jgi:hypothetical protein
VVDAEPLVFLRREAGLHPREIPDVAIYCEPLGRWVKMLWHEGGDLEPIERRYEQGTVTDYLGSTEGEVRAMARTRAEREARRGKQITFGEPYQIPSQTELAAILSTPGQLHHFVYAPLREAAKMAVGYVAWSVSAEVALSAELDELRAFALDGVTPTGDASIGRIGPAFVWLPRTHHLAAVSHGDELPPSRAEYDELVRQCEAAPHSPPGKVRVLSNLTHRIGTRLVDGRAECKIVLFDWITMGVPLPATLPLRWDHIEERDVRPDHHRRHSNCAGGVIL